MTVTVKVPKRFFDDHVDRDLLRGENNEQIARDAVITRELSKHYVLTLNVTQAKELLSDADHYRDGGGGGMDFFELGGLIASAKATYNALIKAGVIR